MVQIEDWYKEAKDTLLPFREVLKAPVSETLVHLWISQKYQTTGNFNLLLEKGKDTARKEGKTYVESAFTNNLNEETGRLVKKGVVKNLVHAVWRDWMVMYFGRRNQAPFPDLQLRYGEKIIEIFKSSGWAIKTGWLICNELFGEIEFNMWWKSFEISFPGMWVKKPNLGHPFFYIYHHAWHEESHIKSIWEATLKEKPTKAEWKKIEKGMKLCLEAKRLLYSDRLLELFCRT